MLDAAFLWNIDVKSIVLVGIMWWTLFPSLANQMLSRRRSHGTSAEKCFSQIDCFLCHTNLCAVERVNVMTPGALLALFLWNTAWNSMNHSSGLCKEIFPSFESHFCVAVGSWIRVTKWRKRENMRLLVLFFIYIYIRCVKACEWYGCCHAYTRCSNINWKSKYLVIWTL